RLHPGDLLRLGAARARQPGPLRPRRIHVHRQRARLRGGAGLEPRPGADLRGPSRAGVPPWLGRGRRRRLLAGDARHQRGAGGLQPPAGAAARWQQGPARPSAAPRRRRLRADLPVCALPPPRRDLLRAKPHLRAHAGPAGVDVRDRPGDRGVTVSRPREAADNVEASPELLAASAGFTLKLPAFEGPLDLLLHLIREHKLDIFDIPIAFILDEYHAYLARMRSLNLDVASEFLVMAATLAHIKSRMLLPRDEAPPEEAEEDAGDPRAELVRRLLEYQKYKAAAEDLARQDLLGRNVFTRSARYAPVPLAEGELGLKEVSVIKLIEAFDQVLARLTPERQHEVRLERISIGEAIDRISARLLERDEVEFWDLFEGEVERQRVIATFLGLLEMVRLRLVRVVQREVDASIRILRTERLGAATVDVQDDYA